MIRRRSFLAASAVLAAATVAPLDGVDAAVQPLYRRAVLGINSPVQDAEPVNAALHGLEQTLGLRFPWASVFWTFDTAAAPQHHAPLIADFAASRRGLQVVFQPEKRGNVVRMRDIAAGRYDTELDNLMSYLRSYPGPVVIRFGHEFNGDWYPWAAAYAQKHPGAAGCAAPIEWVAAWRHVVTLERALRGASNIRWFWCANGNDTGKPKYPMESYWPGRGFVDIAGCDAYNLNPGGWWQSFDQLTAKPYARIRALAPDVPFWVGETGCVEPHAGQQVHGVPVSKGQWLAGMLTSLAFAPTSSLAVHYFNYGNRALTTSPGATAAAIQLYRAAINPAAPAVDRWGVREIV